MRPTQSRIVDIFYEGDDVNPLCIGVSTNTANNKLKVSYDNHLLPEWGNTDERYQYQYGSDTNYYLEEYVKRLQEEYKASLMPETKFFGELGQKVELTLALDRRSFFDTQWGSTAIYAFTDAEGHHFIWKTASWPDALTKVNEGDSIVLKGTIKEHNEYKGCKQTVLTRCKIVA